MFLLDEGKVVEMMEGFYDSYGGVFTDKDHKHELLAAVKKKPEEKDDRWKYTTWGDITDMCCDDGEFSENKNYKASGIAVFHKSCYKGILPTERSDNDPQQGQ